MSKRAASTPANTVRVKPETYARIVELAEKYEISMQKILEQALCQLHERVKKSGVVAIYEDLPDTLTSGQTPTPHAGAGAPAAQNGDKPKPEKADKVCPDGKHCRRMKAVNS